MAKEAKPEAAPEAAPPRKSKKLLIIIAATLVVILALGAAGAFFLIRKHNAENAEEETAAETTKSKKKGGGELWYWLAARGNAMHDSQPAVEQNTGSSAAPCLAASAMACASAGWSCRRRSFLNQKRTVFISRVSWV